MALPDAYRALSLADFNVGAAGAVAFLNPLAAQVDALIAGGLGPFQTALWGAAQPPLAIQASLGLDISNGSANALDAIRQALASLSQLLAALSSILGGFPPPELSLTAQLGAASSLATTLKTQLSFCPGTYSSSLSGQRACGLAAQLAPALADGPYFAVSFSDASTAQVLHGWPERLPAGAFPRTENHFQQPRRLLVSSFSGAPLLISRLSMR